MSTSGTTWQTLECSAGCGRTVEVDPASVGLTCGSRTFFAVPDGWERNGVDDPERVTCDACVGDLLDALLDAMRRW